MKQAHALEEVEGIGKQRLDESEALPALETQGLAERIAYLAAERKALDVRVLRVRELVNYTDWFVICSGRSDRQVAAIREHIASEIKAEAGLRPLSVEGTERHQWVVVDFGEIVVHVFYEPVRDFYQLEALWSDAPELELPDLPEPELTH